MLCKELNEKMEFLLNEKVPGKSIKDKIQHHLNPLHVYSTLVRHGMKRKTAMEISKSLEKFLKPVLGKKLVQT